MNSTFYAFAAKYAMGMPAHVLLFLAVAVLPALYMRALGMEYADMLYSGRPADAGTLLLAVRRALHRPLQLWPDVPCAMLALLLGMVFLYRHGLAGLLPLVFCLGLLALAWLDAHSGLLPDAVTGPLFAFALVCGPLPFWQSLMASVGVWLGIGLFACIYSLLRHQEGLGRGDIKLIAVLAAWFGASAAVLIFWGASVAGLLWWLLQGSQRRAAYAFGPFLCLAALPGFLFGQAGTVAF